MDRVQGIFHCHKARYVREYGQHQWNPWVRFEVRLEKHFRRYQRQDEYVVRQ